MMPLILSVDDYEDDRLLNVVVLESFGFASMSTPDGESALELASRHQPDLILLDICLPRMDGLEVARRLKQNMTTSHIPVIALTALQTEDDQKRILAAGCDDYIAKPYMMEELKSAIRRHLNAAADAPSSENLSSQSA